MALQVNIHHFCAWASRTRAAYLVKSLTYIDCRWWISLFFFFHFYLTPQKYLCPHREPVECGNRPPTTMTSTEWNTLQTMTHRVRCHTSTGCLIAALRTMSTWVKMGRKALYCEMSGGDGVASDLVGQLNTEEARTKRKLVGQHACPILQLRCILSP